MPTDSRKITNPDHPRSLFNSSTNPTAVPTPPNTDRIDIEVVKWIATGPADSMGRSINSVALAREVIDLRDELDELRASVASALTLRQMVLDAEIDRRYNDVTLPGEDPDDAAETAVQLLARLRAVVEENPL